MGGRAPTRGAGLIHFRPSAHPPRRGPFAVLSEIVKDKRPHSQGIAGDRRLYNALPSVDLPSEQAIKPYLEFEHNDEQVIDCVRGKTTFSLTINHSSVRRLASIVKDGDWHGLGRCFPVTLRFEGVKEFWGVQQREVGNYRLLRSSLDGLATMLWDVVALRYIGKDEDALHFDLVFNGSRPILTQEEVENVVSVLLTCEHVSVAENLRRNWIDSVGEDTLDVLDALLKERPVKYGHISEFSRLVEERR